MVNLNCCERMKEFAADFDVDEEDGEIGVLGCCKQCWVVNNVQFCPFCGTKIAGTTIVCEEA